MKGNLQAQEKGGLGLSTTPDSLVQAGLEAGGPQSLKGNQSPGWLEEAE